MITLALTAAGAAKVAAQVSLPDCTSQEISPLDCRVGHRGILTGWGSNLDNKIGHSASNPQTSPFALSGDRRFISISAGGGHSLAISEDRTVWAWGSNSYGQLGDGTTESRDGPVRVVAGAPGGQGPHLSDVVAVATGGDPDSGGFSLALKSDGTVWAWGSNVESRLGSPTFIGEQSSAPVSVQAPPGVRAIDAGLWSSFVLTADGSVWGWGRSCQHEIGFQQTCIVGGTPYGSPTPIPVPGMSGVKAISTGRVHSLALKTDGTLWGWGRNSYGETGLNVSPPFGAPPHPIANMPESPVVSISAGREHNLFTTAAGEVWAFGRNQEGQVGNNSTSNTFEPVKVVDRGVIAVSAGGAHSLALMEDGRALAWGDNHSGQLGIGSTEGKLVPASFIQSSSLRSISAGHDHSLGLLAPRPGISSILPVAGSSAGGTRVTIAGTDLEGTRTVDFGGTILTCGAEGSAQCWADTAKPDRVLHAITPPHAPGPVSVTGNSDGGDSLPAANLFTYFPEVTGVEPACGSINGGQTLRIAGVGLAQATAVRFEGLASVTPSTVSDREISVVSPAGSLAGNVRLSVVSNNQPSPFSSASVFTYGCEVAPVRPPGDSKIPETIAGNPPAPRSPQIPSQSIDASRGAASASGPGAPGNPPPSTAASAGPSSSPGLGFTSSVAPGQLNQLQLIPGASAAPKEGMSTQPLGLGALEGEADPEASPQFLFSAMNSHMWFTMALATVSAALSILVCGIAVSNARRKTGFDFDSANPQEAIQIAF